MGAVALSSENFMSVQRVCCTNIALNCRHMSSTGEITESACFVLDRHHNVFARWFQIKAALRANFPSYDVLEFMGTDPMELQLRTFATAAVIVAPHGAGLANMVVAPLHTPVLEIGPIKCPPCYTRLALKVC